MAFQSARNAFLKRIDARAIEEATRKAEQTTTGEIRVSVLPRQLGPLARAAERTALRLGMTKTRDRNGVLIVVEPARRLFFVWGDRAIHEKVGEGFWKATAEAIAGRFREGDFTGGLVHGVETVGRELSAHVPAGPGERGPRLPDGLDAGTERPGGPSVSG